MQPGDIFEVGNGCFFLIQEVRTEDIAGFYLRWDDEVTHQYWGNLLKKCKKLEGADKSYIFNRFVKSCQERLERLNKEKEQVKNQLSIIQSL